MKIDLSEVLAERNALQSSLQSGKNQLSSARAKLNAVVQSDGLSGQVKDAINNKVANHQIPLVENYITILEVIGNAYDGLIQRFKDTVSETRDDAIINTDYLLTLKQRMADPINQIGEVSADTAKIYADISDIIQIDNPSTDLILSDYEEAVQSLETTVEKMTAFNAYTLDSDVGNLLKTQGSQIGSLSIHGLQPYTGISAKLFYQNTDFKQNVKEYSLATNQHAQRVNLQNRLAKELAKSAKNGYVFQKPVVYEASEAETSVVYYKASELEPLESQKYSSQQLKDLISKAGKGDSRAIQTLASFSVDYQDAVKQGRKLSQKELDKRNQEVWERFEESAINLAGEVFSIYDIYRVITGKDPVTGKDANRAEALFWLAVDLIPVKKLANLVKGANKTLKGVKVLDTLSDAGKVAETFEDTGRISRGINALDTISDANKVAETFEDTGRISRGINALETTNDASKVAETFEDTGRISRGINALDTISDANKVAETFEDTGRISRGINALDTISDANKVAETFEDAGKVVETFDTVGDVAKTEKVTEVFNSWEQMKDAHKGTVTKFVENNKPVGAPHPRNWLNDGGQLAIEQMDDGTQIWRYMNSDGVETVFDPREVLKKPFQLHHYASDKHSIYTPQFKEIGERYGLDLDDMWNKEILPHQGAHPKEYHDFVLDEMQRIGEYAQGDKELFKELFEERIKKPIRENPDMMYKNYWKDLK